MAAEPIALLLDAALGLDPEERAELDTCLRLRQLRDERIQELLDLAKDRLSTPAPT